MTDELLEKLSSLDITDHKVLEEFTDETGVVSEEQPLAKYEEEFVKFLSSNPKLVERSPNLPHCERALIVLSPLSIKHTFGRKWVSKAYLSSIVERPQRLLAVSIGIGAALSAYPSNYKLALSQRKSSLRSPHVLKVHGEEWPNELERLCVESYEKLANGEIETPNEWNTGDIYLVSETIAALEGVIGSIETALDTILKLDDSSPRRAFVAIRPPGHHSHRCSPSGFCLINNAHIAAEYAHATHGVTHAVILDFDLHHGDGTQDICWMKSGFSQDDQEKKKEGTFPKVAYFSLHDINSFPTELGYASVENIRNASTCILGAHDLNIWNIHLDKYSDEEDFYRLYEEKYSKIFEKAESFLLQSKKSHDSTNPFKPILIISAGFDASEHELKTMQRHEVNVPTSFYSRFTSDAVNLSEKYTDGALLSLLEGGYSDSTLISGVFSHLVGLQKQKWENQWGDASFVKELAKGCKTTWKAPKTIPKSSSGSKSSVSPETKNWINQAIKLGRVMIPESVIDTTNSALKNLVSEEPVSRRTLRSRSPLIVKPEAQPTYPIRNNIEFCTDELNDAGNQNVDENVKIKSEQPQDMDAKNMNDLSDIKSEFSDKMSLDSGKLNVNDSELRKTFVKVNGTWMVKNKE